jgi:hypothetical protein
MLHTLCLLVFALVVSVLLKLALESVRVLAMAVTTTAIAAATMYAIAAVTISAVMLVVCSISSISSGGRCWHWPPHVRSAIAAPMTSCWYACIRVRALAQVHIYSWYTMRMQLTEHLA